MSRPTTPIYQEGRSAERIQHLIAEARAQIAVWDSAQPSSSSAEPPAEEEPAAGHVAPAASVTGTSAFRADDDTSEHNDSADEFAVVSQGAHHFEVEQNTADDGTLLPCIIRLVCLPPAV